MELPIYELDIDDESGVDAIAIVDYPAIEREFMAFNEHKKLEFKIESEDKRLVSGALMIADLPIYRREGEKEYYVRFKKDVISKIVYNFFKKGYQANVNLMHDNGQVADGVYLVESMIIDSERGITTPKGFEEMTEGSWFGTMRVENDEIWQKIKDGNFRGFSVEGMFKPKLEKTEEEATIEKIIEVINSIK